MFDTEKTKKRHDEIKKINPRLTQSECELIHNFMNDMAYVLQRMNLSRFTLSTFRSMMGEHFMEYQLESSVMQDFYRPTRQMEALSVIVDNLEFNVFFEKTIRVVVFRSNDLTRHIFEISVSEEQLH